jgi:hypothetical protein
MVRSKTDLEKQSEDRDPGEQRLTETSEKPGSRDAPYPCMSAAVHRPMSDASAKL